MNVPKVMYSLLFYSLLLSAEIPEHILQRMDAYVATISQASYTNCCLLGEIKFNYERVYNVFHAFEATHSYASLITAWYAIKNDTPLDPGEVAEFSVMLIIVYASVIIHAHQSLSPNRVNWFSLIALYAQLNKIPLHKLFSVLEECWQQYQALMELFPKEDHITWSEWLQENWWVPTTIVVFTLFSFIRWYQARVNMRQITFGQNDWFLIS